MEKVVGQNAAINCNKNKGSLTVTLYPMCIFGIFQ
jgi:hypothetical protein